jgi:hypothetical protein
LDEGKYFSLDNQRLVTFQQAGIQEIPIKIISLENQMVAKRFFARFDPIAGEGNSIVMVTTQLRQMSQQLLNNMGLIKGIQLHDEQ